MAKKGKKNQQNWDDDLGEDIPQSEEFGTSTNETTPALDESANGSVEPTEAEEAAPGDFMSTLKKSKKKLDKKSTEDEEKAANGGKPVLKSKKEKEKEKKEKEKQKKKEQAAKKKAQQQAQKEKNKELNKQNSEKLA